MARRTIFGRDLAWIHDRGFAEFAEAAGDEVLRLLPGYGVRRGTLVDLGCGSGIWAQRAGQAGFSVVGVDSSRAMLRLARARTARPVFRRASLQAFALPACDVVTVLGEGLNYAQGWRRPELPRLFRRIAGALRPGGVFLFDALIREGTPMRYRTWRAGRGWVVLVEVSEDRRRGQLTRRIITIRSVRGRIRRGEERHTVHAFRRRFIERALRAAGFRFRASRRLGRMRMEPRRLAFFAQKPRQGIGPEGDGPALSRTKARVMARGRFTAPSPGFRRPPVTSTRGGPRGFSGRAARGFRRSRNCARSRSRARSAPR